MLNLRRGVDFNFGAGFLRLLCIRGFHGVGGRVWRQVIRTIFAGDVPPRCRLRLNPPQDKKVRAAQPGGGADHIWSVRELLLAPVFSSTGAR